MNPKATSHRNGKVRDFSTRLDALCEIGDVKVRECVPNLGVLEQGVILVK